jgi:hypothetical protein
MTEGYIVLATGHVKYITMAANLAASIRVLDPTRRVCLIHDEGAEIPAADRPFFHDCVGLPRDDRYPHVMNKIRVFDYTPYDSTMFVDADCLLAKSDADHWWQVCSTRPFSVTGAPKRAGEWKGVEVADVLAMEGIEYLIQMNAGIFHFDKSPAARAFFQEFEAYYLERMERLSITNYKGPKSQSFELYLGLFMGSKRMDVENVANIGNNSWMVSTWRAVHCDIVPQTGRCIIWKGANHLFGMPFLPRHVARLSPTFPHFIGLKPRRLYARLAAHFRAAAGLG